MDTTGAEQAGDCVIGAGIRYQISKYGLEATNDD